MTTTPHTTDDPFNSAMNPTQPQQDRTFFGEVITVDAWHCTLVKGVGKRVFDPSTDDINSRSTAITLSVECLKRDGTPYTIDQDVLDWSKEWRDFTLPSLRQLGVDLRTLKGRLVQVKRQNTGETYMNKAGEEKTKSALVFMAIYEDQGAMKAAAETLYSTPRAVSQPASPGAAASNPEDTGEHAFALQTLAALWKAVKEDEAKFLQALGNNPMISKYFGPDSPEVRALTLPF